METAVSARARPVWIALGALVVVFHLGLIFSGLVPNLVARPLHMAMVLPWVFLAAAATPLARLSGAVFTVTGVAGCIWIAVNHRMLRDQYGFLEGDFQIALALCLLAVALEGARRMIGWPLPMRCYRSWCSGK